MFHAEKFAQQMEYKKSSEKGDFDGVEEWIISDTTLFGSLNTFNLADDEPHQIYEQQQKYLQEFVYMDDMYLDVLSPPFQSCEDEIMRIIGVESKAMEVAEPKKSRADISPSESFEVLRKYSRRRHVNDHARGPSLSIEMIIKLAAEKFIQPISERSNELSMLDHLYLSSTSTLSNEDFEEVHLVQNLLSCAENVAEKQYERAIGFLKRSRETSSATGTPTQRLAFYVSEALDVKIARKACRKKKHEKKNPVEPLEPAKMANSIPIYYKQFPVTQITNLVGSQTILHYLAKARRIHIVDLEIRSGVQWIQFMQDVVARSGNPVQRLKITAVATSSKKSILEETGRQLASFAESVKLKFTFGVVLVEDVLELNQDLFGLSANESVVVYAAYTLVTMIGRTDRLDHLMKVIRSFSPCIMVVTEMEANCNSPSFTESVVESLFLFGALFDSLADCLTGQETCRMDIESTLFRSSINNVLAAEGEEMMLRHVPIDVWRAYFAGFGLTEIELSFSSLNQANSLLQHCSCGSSITLCRNDRCLTVGWKGTALTSLSAWKVQKC